MILAMGVETHVQVDALLPALARVRAVALAPLKVAAVGSNF